MVIQLKIKSNGFLAWGELSMLVHVPSTSSQSLQDALSGLRAAFSWFIFFLLYQQEGVAMAEEN